ncbi:phosphoribosylanthranilate isomerase [Granulicella arctica]|uniref:N-(5'-phosphoribosyl)anthranilate isomerase n=1 Tax=Granulicella arctica TaxID=940613 RepID=A0A7Y9PEE4_9BACT|nr:phosphoribosylanthranilate isomerase [Granulicella arctica]NYF78382.1 phosphoribosylanthranilate isomerase [Granulicella arctica]
MWVKICANTNLEDALLAAKLGADAVGFVFAPSKRLVTPAEVARITPHLPEGLERVGVFPAWSAEKIAATVREAGLTGVQLHGGFDPELVRALDEVFEGRIKIIQTVHWVVTAGESSEAEVMKQLRLIAQMPVERVLVDSKVGEATGGTGVPFNWAAASGVFAADHGLKLILAGGLRPENVGEAIERLQPWGVDVASGVEASAGRKDLEKVARFIGRAKALRERPQPPGPDAGEAA